MRSSLIKICNTSFFQLSDIFKSCWHSDTPNVDKAFSTTDGQLLHRYHPEACSNTRFPGTETRVHHIKAVIN
jgi:hypothetical protein